MTKRLRKKFILINMLLVGTVLLVVFAAMCVSNYQKLVMDSMKVMERYFDDHWAITRSGCTFPPLNLSTISTWISPASRNHRGSPCPVFIDAAPAFSNMSIS